MLKYLRGYKDEGDQENKKVNWEVHRHFTFLGQLGSGKYSKVFLVRRRSDGQLYSLKQTDITALSPEARQNIINEIRLLASLEHPNLLRFHEAFCDHHQLFLVTEHMARGDLGAFIDKRAEEGRLLPEREVWSYFLQIALGIRHLHQNRILHRDLKPQNILISEASLLKIADLGISQVLDSVFTRALVGTPYYMSPEMWRGEPYSFSADVWALGCILHELCTLKPLFAGRTHEKVKGKVLSGMLDGLPSRYSLDLWDLLRLMLCQEAPARPTMNELLELPSVRARMGELPEQLAPFSAAGSPPAQPIRLMESVQVPCAASDWDSLNMYLPPARYAVGPAAVDALRMRHSCSCPDFGGGAACRSPRGPAQCAVHNSADSSVGHDSASSREPELEQAQRPLIGPSAPPIFHATAATAAAREGEGGPQGRPSWDGGSRLQLRHHGSCGQQTLRRNSSAAVMHTLARSSTLDVADLRVWQGAREAGSPRGLEGAGAGAHDSSSSGGPVQRVHCEQSKARIEREPGAEEAAAPQASRAPQGSSVPEAEPVGCWWSCFKG